MIYLALLTALLQTSSPEPVAVFTGGIDGYPAYRIPSVIVTKKGTLCAFAEGRANLSDHAENDIVLKRSTDGGKTWGALQVIAEDGANCLNNPCAVVLPDGGILVVYQWFPKGLDEHKSRDGVAGDTTSHSYLVRSDDDGLTWSKPADITVQVKRPVGVTSHCSGPGIGIVLTNGPHKGRIMLPFNQGPFGKWEVYAAWSDDQGKSWAFGDVAPGGATHRPNEVQFVELSDGRIMLNARGMAGDKYRKVAVSGDGGKTWSAIADDRALPEPRCMGSVLRAASPVAGEKDWILYSGPDSQQRRAIGTVRASLDDGQTWTRRKVVVPGGFGYSCLVPLREGGIGLIYEGDGYKTIRFTMFTLADLNQDRGK
ncbi:sialidase family protein [Humisphaera borealis]|uniref:exo-alpha-sialidase n=1 Tax=Humisphaera borealis TaxID=2807512 RepID=A0A7M2WTK3_9BACT|nr:sialidase family protein [Humisphaera borealis]QOV88855.1 exo-alpha-sialidase [Humisphaera borealis]